MFGTTGSSFKSDGRFDRTDDGADKKVELRGWKWIKISAKARTSTRVATVAEAPLDVYLQLPPEEYSLLDPQFVKRESPSTFRFTVPMREVIKKDKSYGGPGEILKELTPTILFTTEVDTAGKTSSSRRRRRPRTGGPRHKVRPRVEKRADVGGDVRERARSGR